MSTILIGLFVIGAVAALAIGAFLTLRHFVKIEHLASHQDIIKTALSSVGTLYGILLGFLVAGAVSSHSAADGIVAVEANSLCDIFRFARGLSEPERSTIRNTCRQYNLSVIEDEWPAMDKLESSAKTWASYYSLWDEILALQPKTASETTIQNNLCLCVQSLGESRRGRMAIMLHEAPVLVWLVVSIGSAILIGLLCLMSGENKIVQSLLIAVVTAALCLNILLAYVYSKPFNGSLKVIPYGFAVNVEMFKQPDQTPAHEELFPRLQ